MRINKCNEARGERYDERSMVNKYDAMQCYAMDAME